MCPYRDEDQEGSGGTGSQTGEIQWRFKDPYSTVMRDDVLPPSEIKRLIIVENDVHKALVTKQKTLRDLRASIKKGYSSGAINHMHYGSGNAQGTGFKFKEHPAFLDKPRGIDKQERNLPNEVEDLQTNPEMKNELQNKLENRLQLTNQPQFNPKPRPI